MTSKNSLQKSRLLYQPKLSTIFYDPLSISFKEFSPVLLEKEQEFIQKLFPKTSSQSFVELILEKKEKKASKSLKIGVVFSGGQAPGGHNVISGLFDCLTKMSNSSQLLGFKNGPIGIIENDFVLIDKNLIDQYRNLGGFDMIGSGRTKIETEDQFRNSMQTVKQNMLDGLVIIGGDDSNTNAALLAEYFIQNDCKTKVIGVPKTIDGDLQNAYLNISFGFDTACKTYSEMIGNIAKDCLSAKKYYHFIKLMGRSASHITLECALKIQPNFTIIGEEVFQKKMTLKKIVDDLVDLIIKRAEKGKNYGIILIPEGLIEFIPEIKTLISELNMTLAKESQSIDLIEDFSEKKEFLKNKISTETFTTLEIMPEIIQKQLLLERDPHGNVQVSLIETEKLLMEMVAKELKTKKEKVSFRPFSHFFGYEGRSAFPTNFDANYCYNLGYLATILIHLGRTGYMVSLIPLTEKVNKWKALGLPLTKLMNIEMRTGKEKPVIKKALVDLKGKAFQYFQKNRNHWQIEDWYLSPGPIQFFGKEGLIDSFPSILEIRKE